MSSLFLQMDFNKNLTERGLMEGNVEVKAWKRRGVGYLSPGTAAPGWAGSQGRAGRLYVLYAPQPAGGSLTKTAQLRIATFSLKIVGGGPSQLMLASATFT